MNVHDVQAEEKITAKAIAEGEAADRFDDRLQPRSNEGEDLLALFLGTKTLADTSSLDRPQQPPDRPQQPPSADPPPLPLSLFADDLTYCEQGLFRLGAQQPALHFQVDADSGALALDAPDDLRHRFAQFPREVVPEHGRFRLTTDRQAMGEAIAESRRDEAAWPKVHYLWRLNPVVGWLNDRMLAAFGRHEAPVMVGIPSLADDEAVFVLSGVVPNRKSHPLVHEWVAVTFRGADVRGVERFEELLERTRLAKETVPNRGIAPELARLRELLPDAVEWAKTWLDDHRRAFEKEINEKLNRELEALEVLKRQRVGQLELKLEQSGQSEAFKERLRSTGERQIEQVFDDYLEWVQETMTLERQPYIKVVSVLTGGPSAG